MDGASSKRQRALLEEKIAALRERKAKEERRREDCTNKLDASSTDFELKKWEGERKWCEEKIIECDNEIRKAEEQLAKLLEEEERRRAPATSVTTNTYHGPAVVGSKVNGGIKITTNNVASPGELLKILQERGRKEFKEVSCQLGRVVYLNVSVLREILVAARAVCAIHYGGTNEVIGTAFLVGPQHVVTALHCIDTAAKGKALSRPREEHPLMLEKFCQTCTCWFNYDTPEEPREEFKIAFEQDITLHKRLPDLDVLILKLRTPLAEINGLRDIRPIEVPTKVWSPNPKTRPRCFIVGHPVDVRDEGSNRSGSYKRVSMQRENFIDVAHVDPVKGIARYFTDTAPGNSGSPCFVLVEEKLTLYAVHHTGVEEPSAADERALGYNEGTLISKVVERCPELLDYTRTVNTPKPYENSNN